MSDRDRLSDWGDRPSRARQPLGPSGVEQQRTRGLQRAARTVRRGHPQDPNSPEARGPQKGGRQPGAEGRSRSVAILVLIAVAVIVAIGGIMATTGSISSGGSVPVSIIAFPESTDTTVVQ